MDVIKLSLGYSWKTLDKSSSRLDIHEDVGGCHARRSISVVFEVNLVEDVENEKKRNKEIQFLLIAASSTRISTNTKEFGRLP